MEDQNAKENDFQLTLLYPAKVKGEHRQKTFQTCNVSKTYLP